MHVSNAFVIIETFKTLNTGPTHSHFTNIKYRAWFLGIEIEPYWTQARDRWVSGLIASQYALIVAEVGTEKFVNFSDKTAWIIVCGRSEPSF